ncbi:MAG: hypothetical protein J6Y92_00710 [Lentisphaeria bacterium]|nr:hypothetical protein [Lentisphaeria bacterium]
MKLVQFSLERFRSFTKKRTVDFSNSIVIIGSSNEEKKDFLKALGISFEFFRRIANKEYDYSRLDGGLLCSPKKDNVVYIQNHYLNKHHVSMYNWAQDYPVDLRDKDTKDAESVFVLYLHLSDEECIPTKTMNGFLSNNKDLLIQIKMGLGYEIISVPPYELSPYGVITEIASFVLDRIDICFVEAIDRSINNIDNDSFNELIECLKKLTQK